MPGNPAKTKTLPPQELLIQMARGHLVSRLLYVAAQMNLAEQLSAAPRTADEVARATATHAPSLYRMLRTLASLGLFTEDASHRFSLTPLGRAFNSRTIRSSVLTLAGDVATKSLDHLLYSVETGKTGFEKAFGMPFFEWLAKHPVEASMFNETMVGIHGPEPAAVAAAYDFSRFETVVDVGGSTGNLLAAILGRHAGPRGILFDLPHVVAEAPAFIAARGMADRIHTEAGSFFDGVPAGGSAYLLSHIIHDWSEAQCLTILDNCRRAMPPDGRLLIIEMVLTGGDAPHPGKFLDIMMLTIPGGQERTESEYRVLLEKAGLRLARVVPTASAVSIVEALST